jgi:hypothetical protein
MGSPTHNFNLDAFARQGFEDDVREVQRLWLAGDQEAARRRVPVAIGFGTNLIGTDDLVRQRLRLYRDAGITTLRVGLGGGGRISASPDGADVDAIDAQLADLARLLELVADINAEATAST